MPITPALDRFFELRARGTTVPRELRGAVATFLTMAYILFVNPSILQAAGVPHGSAVACTALAAAVCSIGMGLLANFPIALASGMGLNAFVVAMVAFGTVPSWKTAMGLVVLDGLVVLGLVLVGLREAVMRAIPRDLRLAIGAGIGLFIAFIGLVNAGIVRRGVGPEPPVMPGHLATHGVAVAVVGLLLTAVLMARRVPGALVIGILVATVVHLALTVAESYRLGHGWPAGLFPHTLSLPSFEAAFQADMAGALRWRYVPLLLAVVMVDFFDTLGTATAVAEEAGLMGADGRIPRLRRILAVDSVSASVGGLLGVSSVTSYIESAAGVAEGARTGLHSVAVGLLFLLAVFAAPLAGVVPKEATAPALVLVGFYMLSHVGTLDFRQLDTAIPSFVTLLTIPLTWSISHGIGFGFLAFAVIKVATLRFRDVHPVMYGTAAAFAVYFAWG